MSGRLIGRGGTSAGEPEPISRRSFVYLIGVPWQGVSFSTFSTGWFVLKQYICKGAERAEHAETAGYTYEGTPTTAWYKQPVCLSAGRSSNI